MSQRQTNNKKYYFPGGDVFLLVDNNIFRLHRYFFERESDYFRRKFTLPASPGYPAPGSNELNAIPLSDVTVAEFETFLWVFYNPKYSLYEATFEEWSGIMRLAFRWGFSEVKSLAVRELEKQVMPGIDRIVLYEECQVDREVLIPHYAVLVEREEALTFEEGSLLGMRTSIDIAKVRELVRSAPGDGSTSPLPQGTSPSDIHTRLRQVMTTDSCSPSSPRTQARNGFTSRSPIPRGSNRRPTK